MEEAPPPQKKVSYQERKKIFRRLLLRNYASQKTVDGIFKELEKYVNLEFYIEYRYLSTTKEKKPFCSKQTNKNLREFIPALLK